jgi:uncharacterized protein YeaO (DUF488 family)
MARHDVPALIRIKRVYEAPEREDGLRVLIDRLWPRGMTKDDLRLEDWAKDLAPSNELRRWYGHDPERFAELAARARRGAVTLLTATRELELSHAQVLREVLEAIPERGDR